MPNVGSRTRVARTEDGAAAVEFAVVLPLLVMLVTGILVFGRAYNAKIELTGAVREGARALALGKTTAEAQSAVVAAAPGMGLTSGAVATTPCPSTGTGDASVTATYDMPYSIPFVMNGTWAITVTGVMRCGG